MEKYNYEKIRLKVISAICIGIVLTTLIGLVISKTVVQHFDKNYLRKQMELSQAMYQQSLADDTETLSGVITILQKDRALQDLFLAGDRTGLLAQSENIFRKLRDSYRITHFYYHQLNGQNFLRVHTPDRYGDQIERVTMQQAMASHTMASGIELGPLGTFTLRVVVPWVRDGKTIGYLELGEEIEHITKKISSLMQVDLILLIHKQETTRENWLQGQQLMGRNGNWDLLVNHVLLSTSFSTLPDSVTTFLRTTIDTHSNLHEYYQVTANLIASTSPLRDVTGRELGSFVVCVDISDSIHDLHESTMQYMGYSLLLFIFLLAGYWAYLGKIEKAIHTGKKNLADALAKQENILSSMAEGFVLTKPSGRKIVQVNKKMMEMLGLPEEEILGRPISAFIKDEDLPTAKDIIQQLNNGKQVSGELMITGAGQSCIPCLVTASPLFDKEGKVVGSFSTWNDISDYKKTLRRLLETEENFNRLFHNADNAVTLIRDGKFIACNDKKIEMMGAPDKDAILDCTPGDLAPKRQPDGQLSSDVSQAIIDKVMQTGFHRFEMVQKKHDGTCFPGEFAITLLKINEQPVLHTISKDLSRQKQYEQDLQDAADNAIAANHSKDEFLANMSHEIRTPMNGIIGLTRLTLDTELNEKQQEMLGNVLYSAENLLGLLNDILDFSKIEAGQLALDIHSFNLESMLNRIVSTFHFQIQDKQLFLENTTDHSTLPAFIKTDQLRLRQVIINLIGNSVKFTSTGGITIKTNIEECQDDNFILHFSVQDTGIGIPDDKQQAVFKTFTQADTSTTRKFGGTGLGLAISKQLIELMGGRIWFESVENQGTTFHFTIRVQQGETDTVPEKSFATTPVRQDLHILLVEDNAFNQDIAVAILEKYGYHVQVAENGIEALKVLVKDKFDVIFMDIQMPVLDGLATTGIIRSCEAKEMVDMDDTILQDKLLRKLSGTHIPIIAMTANAMSGDRQRCLDAGMDEYLTKPFMPEQIHQVLHHFFHDEASKSQLP